jgi:hypothetical protein
VGIGDVHFLTALTILLIVYLITCHVRDRKKINALKIGQDDSNAVINLLAEEVLNLKIKLQTYEQKQSNKAERKEGTD